MTVEITEYRDTHRDALHALFTAEDYRDQAERLKLGQHLYEKRYVAVRHDAVLGFVEGTFLDGSGLEPGLFPAPRARIVTLLVSSAARRHRIGSTLLHRFATDALDAGRDALVLFPDPHDPAGRLAFFGRCGLEKLPSGEMLGAHLRTVLANTGRAVPS
ncbi:GNAT family N-acetyltransferase [Streptomyces sp. BE147]|uniref:GNAT family N-acetyltransferase n=1 Tax=unclassified Streptomyces TaxID=2593676 RepID=UPI002E7892B2|nr:GNAT family N-acetyltransferase [Streptomyces sp. BE147]MEE1736625.1 GNAT family N-acetyltransferase [Streptomyces sp. BE147]